MADLFVRQLYFLVHAAKAKKQRASFMTATQQDYTV